MKTVLITGASAGIGYELAHIFAQNKYDLVAAARREDRLIELKTKIEESHGVKVIPVTKDLSLAEAPKEIYEELKNQNTRVDVLVNNAGFGLQGAFKDTDPDAELNMVDLNIRTLTELTKLFLRDMIARHEGKILNVASTAAFLPGPYMSVYYATKAYVLSFSQALAYESKKDGVAVSVLCPGPTETEFQKRAGIENSNLFRGGVFPVYSARKVAVAGYKGLMQGKTIIIPGFFNKFGAYSSRLSPSSITNKIVEKMHGNKG